MRWLPRTKMARGDLLYLCDLNPKIPLWANLKSRRPPLNLGLAFSSSFLSISGVNGKDSWLPTQMASRVTLQSSTITKIMRSTKNTLNFSNIMASSQAHFSSCLWPAQVFLWVYWLTDSTENGFWSLLPSFGACVLSWQGIFKPSRGLSPWDSFWECLSQLATLLLTHLLENISHPPRGPQPTLFTQLESTLDTLSPPLRSFSSILSNGEEHSCLRVPLDSVSHL